MDLAALSMGLSQMNLYQQASMSVMKMAIDQSQSQTVDLVQMMEVSNLTNTDTSVMEQAVTPHFGGRIDISV